jgi:dolichol kinase
MQLRKAIHISGVLIPIIATFIGKNQMIALALFVTAVCLIIEALKQKIPQGILSVVYRDNELKGFSSEPLSYFISIFTLLYLSLYIDEKICFAAIAILAAGDGFAGVVGRRYGRHRFPFNKNKSWEGTISGFIAASLAGFYYAGQIALIGSVFGMMAGAISKHDNIAVPYAALIAMFLLDMNITI